MFYIRYSRYCVLFFCLVLVVLTVRAISLVGSEAASTYPATQRTQQRKAVQAQQLNSFVSGSIGIQEDRGDTVHVYVR